jgi:probable HAF family extracellular repeat protein
LGLSSLAAAQSYTVTDLGALPGDLSSTGNWINATGQIAGCADTSTGSTVPCTNNLPGAHAFLWSSGTGLQDLGTLPGGDSSQAYGINNAGKVIGFSFNSQGFSRGFAWTQGKGMIELGTLPGGTYSAAIAIDSLGDVVGYSDYSNSNGVANAVGWTPDGKIHNLGALPGSAFNNCLGVNDKGKVVGTSVLSAGILHAFLWTRTVGIKDIGTLPGGSQSYGGSVNASGYIAGGSDSSNFPGLFHAVVWDLNLKIHDLGTLPGGNASTASQITDSGVIVGTSTVAGGATHAILWTKSKGMQDLNDLIPANSGWVLVYSNSLNASGKITGYGTINGENHGYLLTPKPSK